eukprot:g23202.t2
MGSMVVKVPNGARVGQLLQMTTPHGTKVQCQVPAGLPPDGTFQVQYPLPTKATLTVHDESARFTSKTVAAHMLPSYWTNVKIPETELVGELVALNFMNSYRNACSCPAKDNDAFDQMIYVDRSLHDTFNELLELTYREKATQDRDEEVERCKKTPGGCPCVQPGGSPGLPTAFKVRRVVRVEDSDMTQAEPLNDQLITLLQVVLKKIRSLDEEGWRHLSVCISQRLDDMHPPEAEAFGREHLVRQLQEAMQVTLQRLQALLEDLPHAADRSGAPIAAAKQWRRIAELAHVDVQNLPARAASSGVHQSEQPRAAAGRDDAGRGVEEMPLQQLEPPAISDEAVDKYSNSFEPLERSLNEVYLWHGTNVRAALSIAQNDFRIDLAGSSTGTMYGSGAYLAEHCTKADEYSSDEPPWLQEFGLPGGYYEDVYALLLCRVCLGKFYYTTVRDTEAGEKVKNGEFDSTVGHLVATRVATRERPVGRCVPTVPGAKVYVIMYSRVHAGDSEKHIENLTRVPYHLQLPVYWANCDKDPAKKAFHEQYLVHKHTVSLLQDLVDACFKGTGTVKLLRAKRVESHGKDLGE